MKKTLKAMLMLLAVLSTGLLVACSSDDDDISRGDVVGYWENVDARNDDALRRAGYQFTADGNINSWMVVGAEMKDRYEGHMGKWWLTDNQLHVDFDDSHYPDGLYYQVESFSKKTFVMNIYGGFAGTPPEKGYRFIYEKLVQPLGKYAGSFEDLYDY